MQLQLLDLEIPLDQYVPIDLSVHNKELEQIAISDPIFCQEYIDSVLKKNCATVAYGGYLEHRNLYQHNENFNSETQQRNIHLGVDFWAEAGTAVVAPSTGTVHSFKNNAISGDYGPTIILTHTNQEGQYYTLYGHLSLESLAGLFVGKTIRRGESFARLGRPEINVNYAPHLHFQIIRKIGSFYGDYPGVCSEDELAFYQMNCPNPLTFNFL
ncbi:peptidoglycan DD-metalloendopeptidase family protein [Flavobacteriaceae bacterium F08102]|nr:peptidoglycan DD-metalloendopeptidase family protein [Flavobacteriaceae bacterium F08102]